jgi:hypothetical protein
MAPDHLRDLVRVIPLRGGQTESNRVKPSQTSLGEMRECPKHGKLPNEPRFFQAQGIVAVQLNLFSKNHGKQNKPKNEHNSEARKTPE